MLRQAAGIFLFMRMGGAGMEKTKVHFFTKAHFPHNQNSSIYVVVCCSRPQITWQTQALNRWGTAAVSVVKLLVSVV